MADLTEPTVVATIRVPLRVDLFVELLTALGAAGVYTIQNGDDGSHEIVREPGEISTLDDY